jgi:excisionase family DNA binding protein
METLMTPRETAECLRLNFMTVYKLARIGNIPATKVGGSWRVERETFDEWLSGQATAMAWQPRSS